MGRTLPKPLYLDDPFWTTLSGRSYRGDLIWATLSGRSKLLCQAPYDMMPRGTMSEMAKGHEFSMDIAIIGAGAAGLAAARRLTEHHNVTVFESLPEIGGVWACSQAAPCQPIYDELRTNIPIDLMAFWDFPFRAQDKDRSTGDFPRADAVQAYLRRFAEHFNLLDFVQRESRVMTVEPLPMDRWQVRWEKDASTRKEAVFDAVVVCSGHYHRPVFPTLPGIDQFSGRVIHAADFRSGDDHLGERVLVWGAHASGTDLVRLIAPHAASIFWSGHADTMTAASADLPNVHCHADITAYHGSTFSFADGEDVQEIDTLIYCTGYAYEFPFFSADLLNHNGERIDDLYLDLIHAECPTLAFIGIPSLIIPFPLFDAQSRWLSALWRGTFTLADQSARQAWVQTRRQAFEALDKPDRSFHRLGEAQMAYMRQLLAQAGEPGPPDGFESASRAAQRHRLEHAGNFRDQPIARLSHRPPS